MDARRGADDQAVGPELAAGGSADRDGGPGVGRAAVSESAPWASYRVEFASPQAARDLPLPMTPKRRVAMSAMTRGVLEFTVNDTAELIQLHDMVWFG